MLKKRTIVMAAALGFAGTGSGFAQQGPETGFAPVNGLEIYYEVHGSEEPLALLHGGVAASEIFAPFMETLTRNRQVILLHLQAHGRTADIERPMASEALGEDVAGVIAHLGLTEVDMLGYSLGGGVALRVAIQHPDLVRKLIVVSAAARSDGQYPEVLAAFEAMPAQASMIAQSVRASPLGAMYPDADWEAIFTKVGEEVRTGFDWTADLAKVTAHTMLVFADADSIRPEHMVEMWKALGGGERDAGLDGSLRPSARLAILPGTTHYNVLASPLFLPAVTAFLDAPGPAGN
jgi:pimeloyl-ACP methyl ester carboxylesterase